MLSVLVDHENYYVRIRASVVVARLGELARPLTKQLLQKFETTDSWSTREQCAEMLGAIGANEIEVLDALFAQLVQTDVPALRGTLADALQKLTPTAARRVLAAAEQGRFADPDSAVSALVAIGEGGVDTMLSALSADGRASRVARSALVRFGWRVVARLERLGHGDMVQEALRHGALRHVMIPDGYRVEVRAAQPELPKLASLRFEVGSASRHSLELWRASEGARGLVLHRIKLTTSFDEGYEKRKVSVTTSTATLSRAAAFAVMRQLAMLRHLELVAEPQHESWWSSAHLHARVHLQLERDVLLDAAFYGNATGDNAPERFRAEGAMHTLLGAVPEDSWRPRAGNADDRLQVAQRLALANADHARVQERLQQMASALGK